MPKIKRMRTPGKGFPDHQMKRKIPTDQTAILILRRMRLSPLAQPELYQSAYGIVLALSIAVSWQTVTSV
jgi:hypothetical protein